MTRFMLTLLIGIAACGPAMAQSGLTAMVSPSLSLSDFRRPITCSGANICATVSPAWGITPLRRADDTSQADGVGAHLAAALLPGPTPRPEPGHIALALSPSNAKN
jgi:hypothetical protein